jgi:drug/metabolite transporter (DMT)-like permease
LPCAAWETRTFAAVKNALPAHLALLAANLIYSANYAVSKWVMPSVIKPFGFILLRVVFAAGCFMLMNLAQKQWRIARADRLRLVLCAVFGVAINQLMFFKGLELTSSIHASLFMISTPVLVIVLAALSGSGNRLNLVSMLGLLAGALGCLLLVYQASEQQTAPQNAPNMLLGDVFIFINAASYAVYLILVKPLTQRYSPITIGGWLFTIGLFMVIPFGANELSVVNWSSITIAQWLCIAYIMVGATVLAYLFYIYSLKTVSTAVAGIYIYLQPLFASLISIALNEDKMDALKIAAGLLIGLAVYLVVVHKPTKSSGST